MEYCPNIKYIVARFAHSTVARFTHSTVARFTHSTIARFAHSTVARFTHSTVARFTRSDVGAVRFFTAIIAAVHSSGPGARSPSKSAPPGPPDCALRAQSFKCSRAYGLRKRSPLSATPGPAGALRAARGRGLLAPADKARSFPSGPRCPMGLQATIPNQGQGKRAMRALDLVWLRLSGPAHSPRPLASIPLSAYSVGRRSAVGLVEEAPNMERQRGVLPRLQSTAAPSLGRISGRRRPLFQRAPQRLFEG